MTFCATALTLHDEITFRHASLPHLPNVKSVFYFLFSNHKMKFILANNFSQNGALNVFTDIPLFPCVCQGELRVVPLFLTNSYRRRLPHSKISSMPLSVSSVIFFNADEIKRTSPTLMNLNWSCAVYSFDIYFFISHDSCVPLSTFCLKAQFITNIIDVFLETYLSFVGMDTLPPILSCFPFFLDVTHKCLMISRRATTHK